MQVSELQSILDFYESYAERDRLASGVGKLEYLRTLALLERYLPPAPASILDVGGATGVYAFPLSERGYKVHLIDVVPLHIQQAKVLSKEKGIPLQKVGVGDARNLPLADQSVDAVLMLGPLYHLPNYHDRLKAINEARRVLRVNGVLFAAGLSRFTSTLDKFRYDQIDSPAFVSSVRQAISDGTRRDPSAYAHKPEELGKEVEAAGFDLEALVGIEGNSWLIPDLEEKWQDATLIEGILDALRELESEPSLLGSSHHFMVIAKRV